MILLADSGSTKTDWCVIAPGQPARYASGAGINPFFMTEQEMADEVRRTVRPCLDVRPEAVYFYGAGCTPEKSPVVEAALRQALTELPGTANSPDTPGMAISVCSDMVGAARALCGHSPGIACILGTGSNSCYFDGEVITANVPPLGFILGDEGSGAVLCKRFVADLLKGQLPVGLRDDFFARHRLTMAEIIDRVYRRPLPNRFLAGFSPYIAEHRSEPAVRRIIVANFHDFFTRNVMQYAWQSVPVHFVGSIAVAYHEELLATAAELGITVGRVLKTPMPGLVAYHSAQ